MTLSKLLSRFFEIPIYKQKTVDKRVNIFRKSFYCVIVSLSMCYKTYCFASQKSHFRNAKTQLLLFNRIIFTKQERFEYYLVNNKKKSVPAMRFLLLSCFALCF